MPSALILITCDIISRQDVLDDLKRIPDLDYVYNLQGYYNIITKVSSDTQEHLRSVIMNNVRLIPKINSTLTLMIMPGNHKGATSRISESVA